MTRATWTTGLALVVMVGCHVSGDRATLPPLSDDSAPISYYELLTRVRWQATAATEAFYNNSWGELEDAAKGLEQTSRFFGKALEIPARHKVSLVEESRELATAAVQLREAARANDVKKTNEILQRINLKVRELRPE